VEEPIPDNAGLVWKKIACEALSQAVEGPVPDKLAWCGRNAHAADMLDVCFDGIRDRCGTWRMNRQM
jgi:hypothetical protein